MEWVGPGVMCPGAPWYLTAVSLILLLGLIAQTPAEAPAPEERPLLLGQLLGAKSSVTVRVGAWFGNLARGPNQLSFESSLETALGIEAPGRSVGVGSGILRDLGLSLTIGDYDFAFSFLSDQLLGDSTDTGDPIANTVLKQILGELRTRALEHLVGSEVWIGVRSGGFEGPLDGSKFQIRDGQVYFGSKNDLWSSSYLAIELGMEKPVFDLFDAFYLRYLQFGVAHALEFTDEDSEGPYVLQSSEVQAFGLGLAFQPRWTLGDFDVELLLASIPGLGVSAVSYGSWGTIYGVLITADLRLEVGYRMELAGALALRPFAAFQTELVMPFTGSFDLEAEGIPGVAIPDYFFWGPLVGLEVQL